MANHYAELRELGVEVYAVSTDTHFFHKAWQDTSEAISKINYPMIGGKLQQSIRAHKGLKVTLVADRIGGQVKDTMGIEIMDKATNAPSTVDLSGVFVQTGLVPNCNFVKGLADVTPYGEIAINERCETNVPGVFACGDVTNAPYKHIIIAMGESLKASLTAFDYLLKHEAETYPPEAA